MAAGAVHVDIPSFRGAGRDHYPLPLLQAMGTSGLFEPWRIIEAGAVWWCYGGPGGAYDYWPEGLDGPMQSECPPFDNVALVADNDRMYHRIGQIGDPDPTDASLSVGAEIQHIDRGWTITDAGEIQARLADEQVRVSILWKARVQPARTHEDRLNPDRVVKTITSDLHTRGIDVPDSTSPLSDETGIDLVHATYYPTVVVDD